MIVSGLRPWQRLSRRLLVRITFARRSTDRDTSSTLLSILCVPISQALSKSVSEYGDYSDRIKVRIIYVWFWLDLREKLLWTRNWFDLIVDRWKMISVQTKNKQRKQNRLTKALKILTPIDLPFRSVGSVQFLGSIYSLPHLAILSPMAFCSATFMSVSGIVHPSLGVNCDCDWDAEEETEEAVMVLLVDREYGEFFDALDWSDWLDWIGFWIQHPSIFCRESRFSMPFFTSCTTCGSTDRV